MSTSTVTERIVATLNDLIQAEPDAVASLLTHSVSVKEATAARPDLVTVGKKDKPKLTVLGLLNGALKSQGEQQIVRVTTDDNRTVGFQIYTPPAVALAEPPAA